MTQAPRQRVAGRLLQQRTVERRQVADVISNKAEFALATKVHLPNPIALLGFLLASDLADS